MIGKNKDLALEMRDLIELHSARNFMRSEGDRNQLDCHQLVYFVLSFVLNS